ncbi:hypothetical protein L1987_78150 [Smallanthus sonchifolius]|uniref:Uncharacterized protein n=1 Tax=Smallanthus sonchifolius TaxID=185202 RepID=A0ACB8ZCE1_9ASTR|nr:hypothetical protein L1987_78150 [Smallanthus sonchifolius]
MAKLFSFTTLRDRWFRYFFSFSGLRSVSRDLGDGTIMHCWIPRTYKPWKPNLLLLHGFGANAMWQYADLLCHFTPKFNVFVPDLLFFGGSFTNRPERSESFQARCVMKLLDGGFGVRRVSLVGISYGGFVGYSMCVQFPKAVERLVVCCAGVCLEEKDLRDGLFRVSDVEEAERILLAQTPEELRELMKFSFVKPLKGIPDYFLSDFINVMCSEFVKEKRELIQSILKDRQLSGFPKIDQPTLILWGDKDQIFPLILGQRLQRHLGENARLVVIANAGHAVNFEKAKEFAKHLKDFLYNESFSPLSNSSSFDSCREDVVR